MDRSYNEQNEAERTHLKAIVGRLSAADQNRPTNPGWTVSAALAHLAHWDRWTLALLEGWERDGVQVTPVDPHPINDRLLAQWLATPVLDAAGEAVAAAETVDQAIAALPRELIEEILTKRPRTIFRAMHRRDHLDEIERALAH